MTSPVPLYGAVPPVADTVTVADPPLQAIAVASEEAAKAADGWVTVTDNVFVDPLTSVTVTVYIPVANPEISWVIAPLDHE